MPQVSEDDSVVGGQVPVPERLEEYLSRRAPALGTRRVNAVERFPNGLSSLSCRVEAETDNGPVTWVLRAEPEHGVIPPYDIAAECRLVERVGAAGLPVPAVLHVESDPAELGSRFALMSFVEGEGYRSADPRFETDTAIVPALGLRFVEMLARIHGVRGHGLTAHADAASAARAFVAVCRRRLAETEVLPRPLIRHALDVLDRRAPEGDKTVLLHGDYRLPNLKWRDGEIVGILDWELARVGDPASDLAFTQLVGAGPCAIEGDLADYYVELTGNVVDDRRIAYYQMLEMVKSTVIGLAGARDIVQGGSDLRLLSVAGLAASAEPVISMLETMLDRVEEVSA